MGVKHSHGPFSDRQSRQPLSSPVSLVSVSSLSPFELNLTLFSKNHLDLCQIACPCPFSVSEMTISRPYLFPSLFSSFSGSFSPHLSITQSPYLSSSPYPPYLLIFLFPYFLSPHLRITPSPRLPIISSSDTACPHGRV